MRPKLFHLRQYLDEEEDGDVSDGGDDVDDEDMVRGSGCAAGAADAAAAAAMVRVPRAQQVVGVAPRRARSAAMMTALT